MKKIILYRKQLEILNKTLDILKNNPHSIFDVRDCYLDLFYESNTNLRSELIEILPAENIGYLRTTLDCIKGASSFYDNKIGSNANTLSVNNIITNITYLKELLEKERTKLSNYTVFYSWQSERLKNINRNFIEDCINKAIRKINQEGNYTLVLDQDTRNVPGSPNIPDTIANKIDNSFCFIGDVTITNDVYKKRKVPNSNVMFETGYALSSLGQSRLVLICNTHYGSIEELPFDIKIRRIASYCLSRSNSADEKSQQKANLIDTLYNALKAILNL